MGDEEIARQNLTLTDVEKTVSPDTSDVALNAVKMISDTLVHSSFINDHYVALIAPQIEQILPIINQVAPENRNEATIQAMRALGDFAAKHGSETTMLGTEAFYKLLSLQTAARSAILTLALDSKDPIVLQAAFKALGQTLEYERVFPEQDYP